MVRVNGHECRVRSSRAKRRPPMTGRFPAGPANAVRGRSRKNPNAGRSKISRWGGSTCFNRSYLDLHVPAATQRQAGGQDPAHRVHLRVAVRKAGSPRSHSRRSYPPCRASRSGKRRSTGASPAQPSREYVSLSTRHGHGPRVGRSGRCLRAATPAGVVTLTAARASPRPNAAAFAEGGGGVLGNRSEGSPFPRTQARSGQPTRCGKIANRVKASYGHGGPRYGDRRGREIPP